MVDELTVYVYYKVPANHREACLLAVKQLQAAVASRYPAIAMQQQKRPSQDETNHETWMETYAGIEQVQLEQFMAYLIELAQAYGLPRERKTEVFINL